MDNYEKNVPIINKIEVDDNAEPVIVQISADKLPSQSEKKQSKSIKKADFVENTTVKSIGKQITMTRLLGVDKFEEENISKRQKLFKRLVTITFIALVAIVLAFTAYSDFSGAGERSFPSSEQLKAIFTSSWQYLILALFSLFLCFFFKGCKLSIMCKSITGKFHFRTCFETGIIGSYYNCVTPLAVGGQPFEIYHLSKHGVHGGAASSMPIAAFFLNQFAFVTLGIVALVLFQSNAFHTPDYIISVFPKIFSVLAIVGLVCCFFMPFMVVFFSMLPRVGSKLVNFAMFLAGKLKLVKNPRVLAYKTVKTVVHNSRCLKKMATNPLVFALTLLVSFGEQLALASIAFFSLKMFGYDLVGVEGFTEWLQVVQISLILYAAISFIPTPGNSGAADLSFYLLFEIGLMAGLAFPAMIIWRIFSFYSFIIIGFFFATLKKRSDKRKALLEKPLE